MRLFCWFGTEALDIESIKAPMRMWRERGGGAALTEDVNGSQHEGDEDEAKKGGEHANLKFVEMKTGLAGRLWSSPAAHLKQMQLRAGLTLSCVATTLRN